MRFQVGDRLLYFGAVYRVTGPTRFVGSFLDVPDREMVPVEPFSDDADRSICGLAVEGLEQHQCVWERPAGSTMRGARSSRWYPQLALLEYVDPRRL